MIEVKNLCKHYGDKKAVNDISFEVKNLCKGEVFSYSKEKGCVVEAAARDLRYKAFEEFITKYDLVFLCLAHNKNDQVETALMRFLQGGSVYSSSCIPQVRQKFIRPLLNISRTQIEEYLLKLNVLWRYDSTNLDNEYLRNKIRNELVPFLNEKFTNTGVNLNGLMGNCTSSFC